MSHYSSALERSSNNAQPMACKQPSQELLATQRQLVDAAGLVVKTTAISRLFGY